MLRARVALQTKNYMTVKSNPSLWKDASHVFGHLVTMAFSVSLQTTAKQRGYLEVLTVALRNVGKLARLCVVLSKVEAK